VSVVAVADGTTVTLVVSEEPVKFGVTGVVGGEGVGARGRLDDGARGGAGQGDGAALAAHDAVGDGHGAGRRAGAGARGATVAVTVIVWPET